MSRYPWTVLGLEAPAGERDIRSAYARRLKVVRPDEDPAGFQVLVEARSLALQLARTQAAEDLVAEDLAAEEVAAEEVAPEDVSPEHDWNDGDRRSIASEGTSVDVVKPVSKIPEAAFSAVSEGVGIDLRSPTQAVATDPPASPSIAAPVSIELQAPAPSPVFPPATGELPSALVAANGIDQRPAFEGRIQRVVSTTLMHQRFGMSGEA